MQPAGRRVIGIIVNGDCRRRHLFLCEYRRREFEPALISPAADAVRPAPFVDRQEPASPMRPVSLRRIGTGRKFLAHRHVAATGYAGFDRHHACGTPKFGRTDSECLHKKSDWDEKDEQPQRHPSTLDPKGRPYARATTMQHPCCGNRRLDSVAPSRSVKSGNVTLPDRAARLQFNAWSARQAGKRYHMERKAA